MSTTRSYSQVFSRRSVFRTLFVAMAALPMVSSAGCRILRSLTFVQPTDPDVKHHLLKKMSLSSHSSAYPREIFDHDMDDTVYLSFVPRNEKNDYSSKTIWFDPLGQEFRTIRQSYKKARELTNRPKEGSTRTHTMPVREMWDHRPGSWTVELYLDDELASRKKFNVR